MEGHHILSCPVIRDVISENNVADCIINGTILILPENCVNFCHKLYGLWPKMVQKYYFITQLTFNLNLISFNKEYKYFNICFKSITEDIDW